VIVDIGGIVYHHCLNVLFINNVHQNSSFYKNFDIGPIHLRLKKIDDSFQNY